MRKNPKVRCPDCGALYDPNETEHIPIEGQPLQPCVVIPIDNDRWDD